MIDIIRPMLELSVVLPGTLLAYLPMKHHLCLKPAKLALILAPPLIVLCICGGALCWYLNVRTHWVQLALVAVATFVYIHTLDVSRWKSVNVVLAICAVFACLSSVARAINAMYTADSTAVWYCIEGSLIYNAMCFAFVGIAWYPASHAVVELLDDEGIAQTWYSFWILPLVFIGLNLFMVPVNPGILFQGRIMQGYIVISLALLAILGLFYALFYVMARNLTKNDQLRQENQFLSMQQARYDNLRGAIEETCHARHDLRHHFTQLSAMAENGDLDRIKTYLSNAQSKIPNLEMHFSDNRAVDSVIGHYCASAQRDSVPFLAQIDLPEELPVDEMDVCLVLSNLLENALEASIKLHPGVRYIKAEAYMHSMRLMLISVENAFDGQIREKDGVFRSSKRKGNGVGIQSVRRIAEKNDGGSSFRYDDGIFSAKVMLRGND